eukprot:245678_1
MSALILYVTCFAIVSAQTTPSPLYGPNGHPMGSDGFETKPCLRLNDFSIDGNWWAETEDEIDWSSVLEGKRTTVDNIEFKSDQNQCQLDTGVRYGWYYDAGIFCDTFDNDEASHFNTRN